MERASVRVLIGIANGLCIFILSNNKLYIAKNDKTNAVTYSEELDVYDIMAMKQIIELHSTQIQALSKTLKELGEKNSLTRIINKCTYLVLDDNQLNSVDPKDMETAFHYGKKRWLYYSKALESWVLLPKGWQKLVNIERFGLDVVYTDTSILEIGETVGVLDNQRCYQWNGVAWDEIATPIDEVGDTYMVQYLLTYDKESSPGTLVYTATGWKYFN